MAQLGRNPFAVQETQEAWVQSLGQEDPQRGEWPPAAVFSPNPRDRGVWWAQTGCCKGLGVTERVAHTHKRVLGERLSRVRPASGRAAAKTTQEAEARAQQTESWPCCTVSEFSSSKDQRVKSALWRAGVLPRRCGDHRKLAALFRQTQGPWDFPGVQWLKLRAPNARVPGAVPGQGTRSHICCN